MHRFVIRAAGAAAILAAGTPAFAHAFLKSSAPPVGGTVVMPPDEVSISFTEDVEPSFSKIAVQDSGGGDVTNGAVHAVDTATLAVPLKKLTPGTYKVTWHATSVDTHKTQGNFTFSVKQ
jgi:copper resistance protein C